MLPAELIRVQRSGRPLGAAAIHEFVDGLVHGSWSDAQVGAMAMAIVWRGLDTADTVALTRAMTLSGQVLDWASAGLSGPVIDKHSTGGVGDTVSLVLAPLLAACGASVPMISGRGLGHTGGTLDKLDALPGYTATPPHAQLLHTLREAGCAIVGASAALAPADRRLYAIRDVTATVESVPLITASILSKKLAAGLQGLVMDVKVGNGAFCTTMDEALALAQSLVDVAGGAGLPTTALITDMNQPLGPAAGNALEVAAALALLTGRRGASAPTGSSGDAVGTRLRDLTLALAATLLCDAGLAADEAAAHQAAARALDSGAAAERFARMVRALGGPPDVLADAALPAAPVVRAVASPADGWLAGCDTRALGLAVVALGGGRVRAGEGIDARVGLSGLLPLGTRVARGQPLAWVHAADDDSAERASADVLTAWHVADAPPAAGPLIHAVLRPARASSYTGV